jgi:hypothetical protein
MNVYMPLLRSLRDLDDRVLYTSGSSGANQKLSITINFNLHTHQLNCRVFISNSYFLTVLYLLRNCKVVDRSRFHIVMFIRDTFCSGNKAAL